MIEFRHTMHLKKTPFVLITVGEDSLLLISAAGTAWMPVWLKEHLMNAVTAELNNPDRRCLPDNVIDLTAARALRMAPLHRTAT